ncbi:predicted protein [Naegleria gruberi]|uniref:Predicted protein n=1 Tax=Naegleria gruberi TaxID=5762 RepID=D2VPV6_NAEGR|nr:uncharacterized protein NAEGRDRAFT_71001 [Naegleria gruberi]EFC41192.1 predicted protein [Naegleria gruberi]|eukprot:XP_002673936.1 predicted protein [Naegleria gruberi strain NEG-M]
MNEMINQMVSCLDEYQDVFALGDSIVHHDDKTIVLTHKEIAKICELGEKTSQIIHVCSTYFEKSITKHNQDERKLLFKIIFDAMGWKISKHKNKLSKYRGL